MFELAIVIITFLIMEFVAWFTHKYVMHGFLWYLHEDHHVLTGNTFQKNDAFALIFAIPSISCFFIGQFHAPSWLIFVGTGILLYGIAYMLVHDIFIHRRLKIFTKPANIYLKGILYAHRLHHIQLGKENGEYFGMLIIPNKVLKIMKKK